MLVAVAGFLIRLLSAGVLDGVLARLGAGDAAASERDRAVAAVAVEQIRSDLARRNAQRDVIIAEQGRLVTALMRPAFAYPLAVYYAAVIADSLFQFEGNVAALPSPIGEWSGWIVSAIFLSESGERITRTLAGRRGLGRDEMRSAT